MIEVVAAVICREDRYLVARRPDNKQHGGLWEFPGGKLAFGESLVSALRRELEEELALDEVRVGAVLKTLETDALRIHFLAVTCTVEPRCREHTAVRWCTRQELASLPLCPADLHFVRSL